MSETERLLYSPEQGEHQYESLADKSASENGIISDKSPPWTRQQKIIAAILAVTNFSWAISLSIIAPFFPNEAEKKGASKLHVGMIFGVFNLVVFVVSPFFGKFIDKIGAKYMMLSGLFLEGGANILFGFLDECPDGAVYIAMCYIVRTVEATGCAMMETASFAIMAKTFPRNVGSAMGYVELFAGVGMIAGPSVGGGLYTLGGFRLPFIVVGGCVLFMTLVSSFFLPSIHELDKFDASLLKMLKVPGCLVIYLVIVCDAVSVTALDPPFSPYLKSTFDLTIGQIGLIFMIGPGVYMFTSPLAGWLADKGPHYQVPLILVGLFLCGLSFLAIGPSSIFSFIPPSMVETVIALVISGFAIGLFFVPVFPMLLRIVMHEGYRDNLQTYGLVSAFISSAFALGGFVGPLMSGAVSDRYGFPVAMSVCGIFTIVVGLIMAGYVLIMKLRGEWPPTLPDTELESTSDPPEPVSA